MKIAGVTVVRTTKYIAVWVIVLSVLMQAAFIFFDEWDYTVIFGNTLSSGAVVLNFYLMGITVQRALSKSVNDAKTAMHLSQLYRFLLLLTVIVIGVTTPCFHTGSVILPLLFPRIAIAFHPLFDKSKL